MPGYLEIVRNGALALLMGLLVGLEREHSQLREEALFAGVRTFPLIALIGFLSGLITQAGFNSVLPVALAGVSALVVAAYWITAQGPHKGATTEFVAILTFLFGVLSAFGHVISAATFAVATAVLLSVKTPLHRLAEKIQSEEMYAILKFGIISVIALPLLPDRGYGPWGVLNPRVIWWMVVLVSAISMVGYLLMKVLGARLGMALTGVFGGLASSTATALGLSQKARESGGKAAAYFSLGIVLASTIMFFRVLFLVWVVDPGLAASLIVPISVPGAVGLLAGWYLWRKKSETASSSLEVKNPMELWKAVQFGLLFGGVLLLARAAHHYFGSTGFLVASGLAGLTDVDAITISTAQMAQKGVFTAGVANAAILLASAVNTAVKGALAASLGGKAMRAIIIPIFIVLLAVTLGMCAFVAWR